MENINNMKLISTLRNRKTQKETVKVISENCSIGQALTMIESWCYDNGADYPSLPSLYKKNGMICVNVYTHDHKYVNFFEISD